MTFWWRRGKRAEWGRGRPTRRLAACHPVSATPLHLPHEAPARLLPRGSRPRPRGPGYVCPVVGGCLRPVSPGLGEWRTLQTRESGPHPRQTDGGPRPPQEGPAQQLSVWGRARGERNSGAGPAAPRRLPARQRRTPKPFAVSWSCWISSDARWLIKNEPWNVFPQPASEDSARVQWRRAPCRVYSDQEPRFLYFSGIWC